MKIPFFPQRLFDPNIQHTTAARHVVPGKVLTHLGPFASDVDRMSQIFGDLASLDVDQMTAYNAWKLMPFENLIWLRLAQFGTDVPITPERLPKIRERLERREPAP